MIRQMEPEFFPPTVLDTDDSLRALALAEKDGWHKFGGLPDEAPTNAVCDLIIDTTDGQVQRALLVRMAKTNQFVVMPYEIVAELELSN